jgi:hypothetical protein
LRGFRKEAMILRISLKWHEEKLTKDAVIFDDAAAT